VLPPDESLVRLSVAASFGLQLVLTVVLLPLVSHARGMLAAALFRELLPRVLLLGVCVSAVAVLAIGWRDLRLHVLLACMAFVCLGHAMARHSLRLHTVLSRAERDPQAVLRPFQVLASAQLAVSFVVVMMV
jgi:hypothetical protein